MCRPFLLIIAVVAGISGCGQIRSTRALSKGATENARQQLYAAWLAEDSAQVSAAWNKRAVAADSLEMKFDFKVFGDKPADGRSLYISLHGGGNVPARMNDQQYENQKRLYKPDEGVYLAPRAPWNDWDMWFKPGIDGLFDKLIRAAVVKEDVNPNKVYIMGYSAGGDGLYRIAPRMADRWAAASMMAGHPGDVSMVNLRNLPFMIWMGQYDSAYKRNAWASVYGAILDSLQKADPQAYIHETHIVEGKKHWMERQDSAAVPWMARFKRDPYPEKILWQQADVMHASFYWVGIPLSEAVKGKVLNVTRKGNRIIIDKSDYKEVTIYLNDQMMNLDKAVVVEKDGKVIFNQKVRRQLSTMEACWKARKDINYVFPANIALRL